MSELAQVSSARSTASRRVAVVGAGISGLICARTLREHGLVVTIFDKSRGPGGRTATRRAEPGLSFDHGAQYFTVKDPQFERFVEAWIRQGIVAEWQGRIVEIEGSVVQKKPAVPKRYVGVPAMTAIASRLADNMALRLNTKIVKLVRDEDDWMLHDDLGQTHGPFGYVVVSLPAPQTADLLGLEALAVDARAVPMNPCWAVMVAFDRPIDAEWDGAFVHGSSLSWVARNCSKPCRDPSKETWVLHATSDWSNAHLEQSPADVAQLLLAEFQKLAQTGAIPTHLHAHRWMFSSTSQSLDRLMLFDKNRGLAVCGDWLAGGRVEGAFRSGVVVANALIQHLSTGPQSETTSNT